MQIYEDDSLHRVKEEKFRRVNCHDVNMKSCLLLTGENMVYCSARAGSPFRGRRRMRQLRPPSKGPDGTEVF